MVNVISQVVLFISRPNSRGLSRRAQARDKTVARFQRNVIERLAALCQMENASIRGFKEDHGGISVGLHDAGYGQNGSGRRSRRGRQRNSGTEQISGLAACTVGCIACAAPQWLAAGLGALGEALESVRREAIRGVLEENCWHKGRAPLGGIATFLAVFTPSHSSFVHCSQQPQHHYAAPTPPNPTPSQP